MMETSRISWDDDFSALPSDLSETITELTSIPTMIYDVDSAANSTFEDFYDYDASKSHDIFDWAELVPTLVIYTIIFTIGLVGNLLIVITIAKYRKMKSTTNVFLCSLASADLLLILFCIPVKILLMDSIGHISTVYNGRKNVGQNPNRKKNRGRDRKHNVSSQNYQVPVHSATSIAALKAGVKNLEIMVKMYEDEVELQNLGGIHGLRVPADDIRYNLKKEILPKCHNSHKYRRNYQSSLISNDQFLESHCQQFGISINPRQAIEHQPLTNHPPSCCLHGGSCCRRTTLKSFTARSNSMPSLDLHTSSSEGLITERIMIVASVSHEKSKWLREDPPKTLEEKDCIETRDEGRDLGAGDGAIERRNIEDFTNETDNKLKENEYQNASEYANDEEINYCSHIEKSLTLPLSSSFYKPRSLSPMQRIKHSLQELLRSFDGNEDKESSGNEPNLFLKIATENNTLDQINPESLEKNNGSGLKIEKEEPRADVQVSESSDTISCVSAGRKSGYIAARELQNGVDPKIVLLETQLRDFEIRFQEHCARKECDSSRRRSTRYHSKLLGCFPYARPISESDDD